MLTQLTVPPVGQSLTVWQTAPGSPTPNSQPFNLALFDRDSATLHVRFFVDGWPYTTAVGQGTATACTKSQGCPVIVQIEGLCDEVVNNQLGTHFIEAYVVDLEWEDVDKNNLTKPQSGGFRTNVWWRFECNEPVETPDAGI